MLCIVCCSEVHGDNAICNHHIGSDYTWDAENNRLMCAFIHRQVLLSRLPAEEREPQHLGVFP